MSHERSAKQLMDALPSSKRPRERPRTRWQNYVEDLAWSRLGIPRKKLRQLQKIGMLGDRNRPATPETLIGQAGKENTLN